MKLSSLPPPAVAARGQQIAQVARHHGRERSSELQLRQPPVRVSLDASASESLKLYRPDGRVDGPASLPGDEPQSVREAELGGLTSVVVSAGADSADGSLRLADEAELRIQGQRGRPKARPVFLEDDAGAGSVSGASYGFFQADAQLRIDRRGALSAASSVFLEEDDELRIQNQGDLSGGGSVLLAEGAQLQVSSHGVMPGSGSLLLADGAQLQVSSHGVMSGSGAFVLPDAAQLQIKENVASPLESLVLASPPKDALPGDAKLELIRPEPKTPELGSAEPSGQPVEPKAGEAPESPGLRHARRKGSHAAPQAKVKEAKPPPERQVSAREYRARMLAQLLEPAAPETKPGANAPSTRGPLSVKAPGDEED